MPDELDILRSRLERARRRLDDATPYSPDWDAAMAQVEDLERRTETMTESVSAA
jgi:hypothetical protein